MKNKITLQVIPPKESEKSFLDNRSFGRFLYGGEEDYILARVLLLMSIHESGMYHYQQTMEKLFKAFLIQKKNSFNNTHDLEKLRKLCLLYDNFFSDPDLIHACLSVTPFEVIGRYPSPLVRSYGWMMPDLAFFLDEFVFEMRQRIDHTGIADVIGELQSTGKITPMDYNDVSKLLSEVFFTENTFFQKKY